MNSPIIVLTILAIVALAHPGKRFGPDFGKLMDVLTMSQRREFGDIMHNQDNTRAQTKQAVKDWIAKQDEKIKQVFEEVEKEHEEQKKKREEERVKQMANLSSDAKAVEEQVHAIFEDDNLTRKQTCEKINEIASKASEAIKAELPHLRVHDCSKAPSHHSPNRRNNRRA